MLFYLAMKRDASEILDTQKRETQNKRENLRELQSFVEPLRQIFSDGKDLNQFGEILHQGWEIKRKLTNVISSTEIDTYYDKARKAGAIGGKLLGAGGGGFLLFYVVKEKQKAVREALSDLYYMPVGFDDAGTRITYYDQMLT